MRAMERELATSAAPPVQLPVFRSAVPRPRTPAHEQENVPVNGHVSAASEAAAAAAARRALRSSSSSASLAAAAALQAAEARELATMRHEQELAERGLSDAACEGLSKAPTAELWQEQEELLCGSSDLQGRLNEYHAGLEELLAGLKMLDDVR